PNNAGQTLMTARLQLVPTPRAVTGSLSVVCCDASHPTLQNLPISQAPTVFASIQAVLRVAGSATPVASAALAANGAYSITNVPPGTYQLTFEVFGDDPHQIGGNIDMPAVQNITVVPNADTAVA